MKYQARDGTRSRVSCLNWLCAACVAKQNFILVNKKTSGLVNYVDLELLLSNLCDSLLMTETAERCFFA